MEQSLAVTPLAVTLGDPAGIGPEIILKAWLAREEAGLPRFFVVGSAKVLHEAALALALEIPIITGFPEDGAFDELPVDSLAVRPTHDLAYTPGRPNADGAKAAYDVLDGGIYFALQGYASGVVTAPLSKAQIAQQEPGFVGQTELLAERCKHHGTDAVMLLAGPSVKAVPLTVHCPLSEVPARITQDLILRRTHIVRKAMQSDFGITNPHIAIAGLNPHAGEDGHLGREEIETIAPAIKQLQAEGINATGPHPADALFAPHKRGTYDVAIAMYHDQALAPMKALDFDSGVNMTLGLPIVRTSPDHGTAFDIAGKGIADPGAMIAAIKMAGEVAARRAGG